MNKEFEWISLIISFGGALSFKFSTWSYSSLVNYLFNIKFFVYFLKMLTFLYLDFPSLGLDDTYQEQFLFNINFLVLLSLKQKMEHNFHLVK